MTRFTILGLGEAGLRYATGLADAGAAAVGYDPYVDAPDAAVARAQSLSEALAGADVVLSLTGACASVPAARQALTLMPAGAVYADLNTSAVATKAAIARMATEHDALMADGAILAPVPRAGHRTQLAASGPGAERFAELSAPFGIPVEVVGATVGDAARLKLLRSVFMKGLAALVIEGLTAAEAVGAERWLRAQIGAELGPDGDALVERLVSGTYAHAERREHEVRDALAALETAGQPADMTRAALAWFERITAGPSACAPTPRR